MRNDSDADVIDYLYINISDSDISEILFITAIFREPETGFLVFYDPTYRKTCRNLIYRPFFGNGPFRRSEVHLST